ncbi:MAG: molybdopterin-binding protein [Nitrososphaerota archaeon]
MKKLNAEVLNVGNELLDGRTLNTNLHWLCGRLSEIGYVVERATIVRDDVSDIASSVKEALRRRPKWLLISGGLGPTHDDKTLQGVAKALGRVLRLDRVALEMLKTRYEELWKKGLMPSVELTEERLKMARLPVGSKPLVNRVGSAPGVLIELKSTKLVCLPGVPAEMKDIFMNEVKPLMVMESGGQSYVMESVTIKGVFESTLAPLLVETMRRFPQIYLKSNPKGFEEGISAVTVDLIALGKDVEKVGEAKAYLERRVAEIVKGSGSNPTTP